MSHEYEKKVEKQGFAIVETLEAMVGGPEGLEEAIKDVAHDWLQDLLSEGHFYIEWADKYCEPGYTQSEKGVLFANWNKETKYNRETKELETLHSAMEAISKVAEAMDYECEWSDEWATCQECNGAVRTSADCYSWTRYYALIDDCELVCADCIEEDPEQYLEDLSGNSDKAVTFPIDLYEHGYHNLNDDAIERSFENGLYGGQDASPHKIAMALENSGITDFIFKIDSVGQFDSKFSVWVQEEDLQVAGKVVFEDDSYHAEVDPAEAMKAGLEQASEKMAQLPEGEGVKHATINPDGTATVKLVSQEDFIEGNI